MTAALNNYTVKAKKINFPIYFPDATRGIVRSLDSQDLKAAKIEGLVVNTYHLLSQPGMTVIKQAGGIKQFMDWDGWVASDSGGFQLLSLIYRNSAFGRIDNRGVVFYKGSKGKKKRYDFTPEKSIQVQFSLDPDIIICLDDCPAKNAKPEEVEISVNRTIEWAKRCKDEYQKITHFHKMPANRRPLLLAVIQGQDDKKQRERCAKELLQIGFDAYGFGGWPLDENNQFNEEIVRFTSLLTPDNQPKFGLGIGNPKAIIAGFKAGYHIFDCVLPTRDARHKRLYVFDKNPEDTGFIYIDREKYVRDFRPISKSCDCHACQHYSRSYLHHLFEIEESLAWRLATIHNLRTYSRLIEYLRKNGE